MSARRRALIAHIIHSLDYGGLENGLTNLINRMPQDRYRHAIVCLTGHSTFRRRLQRDDVEVIALGKRAGKDLPAYLRLWRLLRRLRPDIVHSRNFGTMDCATVARLAGVRVRVHGEHGWDIVDLHGRNPKHRRLRRLFDRSITKYVTVSADIQRWLVADNGVSPDKIINIINVVDTDRFHPRTGQRTQLPEPLRDPACLVFGTVGRMHPVKNPLALARAYLRVLAAGSGRGRKIGLVMVGDGPLAEQVRCALDDVDCARTVWLPGMRDDVPEILRELDVFVLPSLNEGISNTVLEAMASGLAVIAADVGGNPELVAHGRTGTLTSESSEDAFADAMLSYLEDPQLISRHGDASRRRALEEFRLDSMVSKYVDLYDSLMER
jgi:sugar transferase (PEP-CTERM/EpsH1 system associated)